MYFILFFFPNHALCQFLDQNRGFDINTKTAYQETALYIAAREVGRRVSCVKIKGNTIPPFPLFDTWTPLTLVQPTPPDVLARHPAGRDTCA